MTGVKISNLPAIVTPVATDVFPVSQSGVTYKETIAQLGSLVMLLSGGTMTGDLILSGDPTLALEAATKQYVDAVATGLLIQAPCVCGTTAALTTLYNNGASGVGATLTNNGALAAFSVDGISPTVGQRVLVKNQASTFENGIYTVTTVGSGAVAWVLTRATDYDTAAEIQPGDYVLVLNGTVNAATSYVQTATVTTIGVDAITWNQFSSDINTLITNIQNSAYNYAEDTGAADAYVATLSPAITAYVEGLVVILDPDNANATTTPTINVNALGVKTITDNLGGALVAGDIVPSQRIYLLYDGTNFRLINRNYEKRIQNESFSYILDTGAADAYVATLVPAATAYVTGLRISLKIATTNTGASTLNVNGLGVKNIKNTSGGDPAAGDLVAGSIVDMRYDGTNFQILNIAYNRMAKSGANADITSMTGLTGALKAPTGVNDTNGNEVLKFASVASAVNEITIENAATGGSPSIETSGGDASINLDLGAKGGTVNFYDTAGVASGTLRALNAAKTFGTGLTVATAQAADLNLTLPATDGSDNFIIKTNGSAVLSFANGSQIAGTATNDNASAGNIGEYISSSVLSGSAVSLTSGAPANVTSISLTAGDWDVSGSIKTLPNAATTTSYVLGGISTTSATIPTSGTENCVMGGYYALAAGQYITISNGQMRISLSGTTTVYLVVTAGFAINTLSAYGFIGARRVR